MQALHSLIHSLAKEEKRLYNLHGRKGRFQNIYEGYIHSPVFDKELDRQIYSAQFSSFSKAFYSMQKNALLDDILAVLLEYSNSSKPEYNVSRLRSKYEILLHKKFYDLAVQYLKDAIPVAKKAGMLQDYLRMLEDYVMTLANSTKATWEEYEEIEIEIEEARRSLHKTKPVEDNIYKLKILVTSAKNNPSEIEKYKHIALNILDNLEELTVKTGDPQSDIELFNCQYLYSGSFEDKFELHQRLIGFDKKLNSDRFAPSVRMKVVNLLLESAMDCGDFLLINGIIYKMKKLVKQFPDEIQKEHMPKFLELCAMYHFYENEITESQNELHELLSLPGLSEEVKIRNYYHLASVQVAANLARSAKESLQLLSAYKSSESQRLKFKLLNLIIAIEMNEKEDALSQTQRIKSFIRKLDNPRQYAHYRQFLEVCEKFLEGKTTKLPEFSNLEGNWKELLKIKQWLGAKLDNSFYYNGILNFWRERRKVLT